MQCLQDPKHYGYSGVDIQGSIAPTERPRPPSLSSSLPLPHRAELLRSGLTRRNGRTADQASNAEWATQRLLPASPLQNKLVKICGHGLHLLTMVAVLMAPITAGFASTEA